MGASGNQSAPAHAFTAVTPHDSTNLAHPARALYVGTAGNVVAVSDSDVAVTFVGVQAGSVLPIRCKRVNSTNTTASDIVALY